MTEATGMEMLEMDWPDAAWRLAKLAHTEHFSSRRGAWKAGSALVLYDNNPFTGDPGRRPWQEQQLRRFFERVGIRELAHSLYPNLGGDRGYTSVIVVEAAERLDEVCRVWGNIVTAGWVPRPLELDARWWHEPRLKPPRAITVDHDR